jgi:hypothetical protein
MDAKAIEREEKVKLIKDISRLLIIHDQPPMTTHDFDVLYDMRVSELISTRREITHHLELLEL